MDDNDKYTVKRVGEVKLIFDHLSFGSTVQSTVLTVKIAAFSSIVNMKKPQFQMFKTIKTCFNSVDLFLQYLQIPRPP